MSGPETTTGADGAEPLVQAARAAMMAAAERAARRRARHTKTPLRRLAPAAARKSHASKRVPGLLGVLPAVLRAAAEVAGLTIGDLTGRSRAKDVVAVRHAAMVAAVEYFGRSLWETGRGFDRDHTCVVQARRKALACPELAALAERIAFGAMRLVRRGPIDPAARPEPRQVQGPAAPAPATAAPAVPKARPAVVTLAQREAVIALRRQGLSIFAIERRGVAPASVAAAILGVHYAPRSPRHGSRP